MVCSDYSEVMLLDSLQLYLLAQRILLSLVLSLKTIILKIDCSMFLILINNLLYAVW